MINSTPEIVMAPSAYLRDESYQLYHTLFRDRAPVLYAATADGQIHAFAIDRDQRGLNELWSFMPPAVLPALATQFPQRYSAVNSTIISGPLVAAEVAGDATADTSTGRFLTRNAPNAEQSDDSKWYSILLGSFGASGGYFALDVTNPDPASDKSAAGYQSGPRFLWQLTKDAQGNPLFGSRATRPAAATLFFVMPQGAGPGTTPAQHAVAILPGGYGGVRSTTGRETTTYPAGSKVNMDVTNRADTALYSPAFASPFDRMALAGARSITVVRLDTGEVVRTFRRSDTYNPTNPEGPIELYNQYRVTQAPFAAPIVGSIVAYPNTPGSVSDRAFFGDAEGRLWRLDLSSPNPRDWSVALFHDAYPTGGPGAGDYSNEDVEPIETPPILSTDPLGRLTIAVSTGEQTSLGETGMHSVWSLSEWREAGILRSHVNWFLNSTNTHGAAGSDGAHFAKGSGERVTGPMALFSSVLYFTTYDPSGRDLKTCSPGNSYLWGVHYLQSGTTPFALSAYPDDGPMPQFHDPGTEEVVRAVAIQNGVAFGVGVQQKPSCIETDMNDDPFLGLTGHQSISSVSRGSFQLVVQIGGTGVSGSDKIGISSAVYELPPPTARSQIDSWAAILD